MREGLDLPEVSLVAILEKRQKEIIDLLENTLLQESKKLNGGNSELVQSLTKKLEQVKNWEEKQDVK